MKQQPDMQQQPPKTMGDKLIRCGAIAAAVTAIIVLVVMVFVAGDKYAMTPAIQTRAIPLIEKHEKNDSTKWCKNEKDHTDIRSLQWQMFKVQMTYTKAGMSEQAKQAAADQLVNDTTIAPELKLQ